MGRDTLSAVVRRTEAELGEPDAALLDRFTRTADHAAFAELVRRHTRLVWGRCRAALGCDADADDALQATFLALARHSQSVRDPGRLGPWLYAVAGRVCKNARRTAARRVAREGRAAVPEAGVPVADAAWDRAATAVYEEVDQLPPALREAFVLCHLEGVPPTVAAERLKVVWGTFSARLARARERLLERLAARGIGAVVAVGVLQPPAAPAAVVGRAVAVALGASESVLSLVRGVVPMTAPRGKALLVLAAVVAIGAGALVPGAAQDNPTAKPPTPQAKAKADLHGDPLPDGAVVRLGSSLFRHAGVRTFAFLPDGKRVVTGGSDGRLRRWDLATGREAGSVPLPDGSTWVAALSPDGKYAAVLGDKDVTVLDAETGKAKGSFPVPGKGRVVEVFFSSDGGTVGVLADEPRLTLTDWRTGKEKELTLPTVKFLPDSTFHARFSTDGRWVVAGSGQWKEVCVYDVATGEQKHRLTCSPTHTVVTADGKKLVASCHRSDGQKGVEVVTFDLDTGQEASRFSLDGKDTFFSLAVSPDGGTLACGFSDTSCLVDLATGRVKHELPGRPIGVTFTPDGGRVVAWTGQRLRVWATADGKEQLDRPGTLGGLSALAVSPDGRWLAAADWIDKGVAVWDLTNGRLVRTLPFRGEEGRYVRAVGFTPDGKAMWAGSYKGFIQWWDPATGKEMRAERLASPTPNGPPLDYLRQVRVSADGTTAAVLAQVGGVTEQTALAVWEVGSGRLTGQRLLPAGQRAWAWAPDGSVVALSTPDGLVVADAADPAHTRFTVRAAAAEGSLAFAPDSRTVAVRKAADKGADAAAGVVLVVEVASGGVAITVKTGPVDHLALVGSRTLVVAGGGTLRAFDLADGKEVGRWSLPTAATALLSVGGRRVVTALADGTGLVWELPAVVTGRAGKETPAELWASLAGEDAAVAHRSGWALADRPADAVAVIREHLKPVAAADAGTVAGLVAKLGDPTFAEREAATRALTALGPSARAALRAALAGELSPEQTARVERVLAAGDGPAVSLLREVRAVAVLERAGTADARKVLDELAGGVPDALLTREAAAAVKRLDGRAK